MLVNRQTDRVSLLRKEYKTTGGINLRNQLVEEYRDMVFWQAEKIKSRLPKFIELKDLVSAGVFGLMTEQSGK